MGNQNTDNQFLWEQRLKKIYIEAGRLFNLKSYADTKMAEIAKASGIAVGTMYSMFSGKDAVLSFVIQATLDKDYFSKEITLPIKIVDTQVLLDLLRKVIGKIEESVLKITNENGEICKDFPTLIGELFDLFREYLLAFDIIESNWDVLEELNREYIPRKREFFTELQNCLQMYIDAGQIRQMEYLSLYIPFLIDTLTWWALNSSLHNPGVSVEPDKAKEIGVGAVIRICQP